MNRLPNIILTTLGAVLLAISLSMISIVYWIASNLLAILAAVGCLAILFYFVATTYSYYNSVKSIRANFFFEEQEKLLASLRRKTIASAVKAAVIMLIYAGLWGIVIYFVSTQLL